LKDIWESHLYIIARCLILYKLKLYITTGHLIFWEPCLSTLRMVLILGRALIQFLIFRVLTKDMLHTLRHTFSGN
jgi:hypothetical protein